MKTLLQIVILVFPTLLFCQNNEQKIKTLITDFGYVQGMKNAIETLKSQNSISQQIKFSDDEIIRRISQAYQESFSETEINELYNFYTSKTGKKFLTNQKLVDENIQSKFPELFGIVDLDPNQKEINKQQDYTRNYLTNFLEATYEKEDGFYLLTETKNENGNSLEMENNPTFSPKDVEKIDIIQNEGKRPYLRVYFKKKTQENFKKLLSKNIGNGFATLVDKKIIMMTPISNDTPNDFIEIIGLFDNEQVNNLKSKLKK